MTLYLLSRPGNRVRTGRSSKGDADRGEWLGRRGEGAYRVFVHSFFIIITEIVEGH
jgi:hypothetical protein